MISCDVCEDWYHLRCVGMTQTAAKSMKKYTCPVCVALKGNAEPLEAALAKVCTSLLRFADGPHTVQLMLLGTDPRQAALERQDLSCTYLAHHEPESVMIILIITDPSKHRV